MNVKRRPMSPREVVGCLLEDGFEELPGKGDHRNFKKPGVGRVTVDMGVREIPIGTLRSIFRQARWNW